MRLKALEMQGFKSFPDKTVLSFDQGITVVVGPNGSGKSNITDAVRWVLGEMSTKSIRGSKMEDVIFGGSDNRRPMGYAEVSLVIDNTVGISRLESDYDEVTVTRRYYRGGDSEYRINGKTVRLRDIAELFMNTGVGKTGYSNIGQGKIAEIISQKSDERRSVFEEAAGISKYRFRKNEAERKLKETEANLLRLNDILGELSSRVGPLEKEAAAARRYLELYEQKKTVDVSLWLYDAEAMRARANETERAYMAAKLELEGADSEIASLEQRSEGLYQKAAERQARAEELTMAVSRYTDQRHGLESTSRVLENDILHTESRMEQTKNEREARCQSLSDGQKRSEELASGLRISEEALAALIAELAALETERLAVQAHVEEKEAEILDREDEAALIEASLVDVRVRLSALEGSHESESGRSADLENEMALAEEEMAQLSDRRTRTDRTIEEYRIAIEAETSVEADKAGEEEALAAELETVKETVNRLQMTVETKKHRADTLKRMDDLLEGYHFSVKNVMHAVQNGRLQGIHGPVSKLISVNPAYSIAIETALGANIQNIVTEDEEAAKAAIAFLKKTNGGRATFYPITSVKASSPTVASSELAKHAGYVGMADALCGYDKAFDGIIGYLLGRTAVFDTIDHAAYTAKAFGYRIRIVTLDGQLVNAGGSFTGGSVKQDSGILTRSAEIAGIHSEIAKLEIELRACDLQHTELSERMTAIRSERESVRSKMVLLTTLMQAEQTQLEVTKSRLETVETRLATLRADLEGLGKENAYYDEEYRRLTEQIASLQTELAEAKARTAATVEKRNALDDRLADLTSAINAKQIARTAAEKDIESLNGNLALNIGTVSALEEQIRRSDELLEALSEKLREIRRRIGENKQSSEALTGDIAALEAERGRILAENLEVEKQQSRIREQLRDQTHRRETIFREFTKLEGQREHLTTEHDRLAAKIWEDYELTYTAAVELNYPPVTEETRPAFGAKQTELRNKLRALGSVNVGAIEEYAEVKARYDFTTAQVEDLTKAQESLNGIIERLEREMKTKFVTAVEEINKNFKITFRELFGGGNAEISLSDPENVLTSGIEINVAPPGKIIKNLISLSGGEQAFVAIALIFAILNVNPTPFCIFDEIESALDEVNVVRLADYMHRYSEKTQFIVITHRRGTMEASDMLYGITMPDRGISRVLSMNVNEAEQRIGGNLN
ncbi:MAG: chromosome segregation protein SMC [Ruminococcaceae bacterium]|nr:chromosome segregation protein SMC [Oscillospiraceae bacterium]